jgi:molybdopterin molybdotransferase
METRRASSGHTSRIFGGKHNMKTVSEALAEILVVFSRLPAESVPLIEALGRVLAENAIAADDLPPFDNSSMDGYAALAEDLTQTPVSLAVIGDIPAGIHPTFTVAKGQTARIMTGAMMPQGANTIIPVEDTNIPPGDTPLPEQVEVQHGGKPGAYIRRRGEDVKTGEVVLNAGHVLRPQDLGLLAGLGIANALVVRRPKVAILSTGDELLTPDQPLQPGKIRDMNSYSLIAMVQAMGAEPVYLGIAGDTAQAVREYLLEAVERDADLILSSAGVSVGTHDVVKTVLDELGSVGFWRVKMRPGKPLAFGQVRGVPFLGLPGNPVSSLATFEVFVRPAILKMLGQPTAPTQIEVSVGEEIRNDGRESYIRVTLHREGDQLIAKTTGTQSSVALSSLVKADGLLIIPAEKERLLPGDRAWIRPFAGQPILK